MYLWLAIYAHVQCIICRAFVNVSSPCIRIVNLHRLLLFFYYFQTCIVLTPINTNIGIIFIKRGSFLILKVKIIVIMNNATLEIEIKYYLESYMLNQECIKFFYQKCIYFTKYIFESSKLYFFLFKCEMYWYYSNDCFVFYVLFCVFLQELMSLNCFMYDGDNICHACPLITVLNSAFETQTLSFVFKKAKCTLLYIYNGR